jgi:hypothetical protein
LDNKNYLNTSVSFSLFEFKPIKFEFLFSFQVLILNPNKFFLIINMEIYST